MKIFFYDDDKRINEPNYHKKMSSFGTVAYNFNQVFKSLNVFSEINDTEWVGKCGSLDPNFRVSNKKTFYINVWETNNTLPYYLLQAAKGQKMFGLCNKTTNLWKKYGFNCETIYGGCDTEYWHQTQEKNKDVFTFCHVNHATVRSGLEITLQAFNLAFKSSKNVQLIIKDSGGSNHKLKKYIDSLDSNIVYINEMWDSDQIRDLYSKSHATINLLRSTSFGMPLLECSACNSLCITGNVTPTNELVDSSFAKMIQPNQEVAIYPLINELEEKYGLKNYYGGFKYPETPLFWDFDIQNVATQLKEIYDNWSFYKTIEKRQPIINRWKWEFSAQKLVLELNKL